MSAYCPNCEKEIAIQAQECEHCGADFSSVEAWKPTSEPGTWKQKITWPGTIFQVVGRLLVGGIVWFAFMVFAVFAGFIGGNSTGGLLVGLANFLALGFLVWAFLPIVRLFSSK